MGVLDDYAARLRRSESVILQLRELEKQEIVRRDLLITEAFHQAGMSKRKIASVVGRSRARVYQVLGRG